MWWFLLNKKDLFLYPLKYDTSYVGGCSDNLLDYRVYRWIAYIAFSRD